MPKKRSKTAAQIIEALDGKPHIFLLDESGESGGLNISAQITLKQAINMLRAACTACPGLHEAVVTLGNELAYESAMENLSGSHRDN